jgi:CRISPR system Cascade subunit CasC
MKKLIEIHILQNFAPSNLNRDDTGAPKDAIFGGSRRSRVSSQCLKRAVRQHFRGLIEQGQLTPEDVAVRTKRVLDELVKALAAKGKKVEEADEKVRQAFAAIELTIKEDGKNQYLLFLGKREIEAAADVIEKYWKDIKAETPSEDKKDKKAGKAKKDAAKDASPELKKALEKVFNGGKSLDVALFGRMLADMPENNQDAACQVAHAISTHTVDREFDFYTAVDDLKPEDSSGADMMGTVEFNSACLYRYAVVDWTKLVKNLQEDEGLAKKGLRAFLEGFVVAEPTGKQNTFAAHNQPEFVAVKVRKDCAPRNIANAFEVPVRIKKDQSLTGESAIRLVEKDKTLQTAYGGDGSTYVLNLTGADIQGYATPVKSLQELLDKTMSSLEG